MNRAQLMAIAAAAMATMGSGPSHTRLTPMVALSNFASYGGRENLRPRRGWGSKNREARHNGIPKAFRQHARRYHSDVHTLMQMHRQYPAPLLDHWRDRCGGRGRPT